ncbi:MAG: hypothetical protein ACK40M_07305 [Flavobacteriales bacterium]
MRNFLLLLFVLVAFSVNAQDNKKAGWTFLKAEKGIKVYYQYVDCDFNIAPDAQYVLLKFENTLGMPVYVEYEQLLWYNGHCGLCTSDPNGESKKQIKVAANGTTEGKCDETGDSSLKIFVKFNAFQTPDLLTKFEINNIIITPINE